MTTTTVATGRPSRLVMARSRGAVAGPLLMLLGIWGAIIPFVGHYFGYGYTPDNTWGWTAARGWMEVAPGVATFIGGALITTSAHRASAMLGGWLAAIGGAWFVLGTVFMPLWNPGWIGTPSGDLNSQVLERLGMFSGLGVVIVFFAAFAMGRFSVIGVRDVAAAEAATAVAAREVDVRDGGAPAAYPAGATATGAAPAGTTATGATAPAGTTGTTGSGAAVPEDTAAVPQEGMATGTTRGTTRRPVV